MNLESRLEALAETRLLKEQLFEDGKVHVVVACRIYVVGPCPPEELYYLVDTDNASCSCIDIRGIQCEHEGAAQLMSDAEAAIPYDDF